MSWRRSRSFYPDSQWAPYVPVSQRRAAAARLSAQHAKKHGRPLQGIRIEGHAIASTFWGRAWCDHLESYSDFSNRMARGRTYVRNGSVIDLQLSPGKVAALVSGSRIYTVAVDIKPLPRPRWQDIVRACSGKIDSLIELLQGRLADGVLKVFVDRQAGLFPAPAEISVSCSCPDYATMCKHVAAVLYGVGSRLDSAPELFFTLRQVDHADLVSAAASAEVVSDKGPASGDRLESSDLSAVFGIDLEDAPADSLPSLPKKSKRPAKRPTPPTAKPKPAKAAERPAAVAPRVKRGLPRDPKDPASYRLGVRVTTKDLATLGIPRTTFQNWITGGVLIRSGDRGVYLATASTAARMAHFLACRPA